MCRKLFFHSLVLLFSETTLFAETCCSRMSDFLGSRPHEDFYSFKNEDVAKVKFVFNYPKKYTNVTFRHKKYRYQVIKEGGNYQLSFWNISQNNERLVSNQPIDDIRNEKFLLDFMAYENQDNKININDARVIWTDLGDFKKNKKVEENDEKEEEGEKSNRKRLLKCLDLENVEAGYGGFFVVKIDLAANNENSVVYLFLGYNMTKGTFTNLHYENLNVFLKREGEDVVEILKGFEVQRSSDGGENKVEIDLH